ncbi:hypothetical protein GCM10023194_27400 [Planotetraspora phitsanulokensis]|uniref:GPR1/FUN34/yaaH family protein n=1 Tax=Planotetraspora phitsanulokensis TaxID=575192 RepID=A0A8J3XH27_9ACTN|nr:GPR1/FUN34/YaaH family transporter [Planotetraspora phitsanulokensis]GII36123.1 hypothetical protein Pph01_11260 [Planotetraspora phitsanulokensis]
MTESREHGPYSGPAGAEGQRTGSTRSELDTDEREFSFWQDRTRVFLQPIAAPSILGYFAFATATMMVGAWMARWYGTILTPVILFPFLLTAGLAQLMAATWSYRARDGLATAVHGMWGAFWFAFGLMFMLVALGAFPIALAPRIGVANPSFAFWFIALCLITGLCALAATARNLGLAVLLILLAVGSGFAAAGFFSGASWLVIIAGWLFVASAAAALYVAGAMLLEGSFGRTILPLGHYTAAANVPGRKVTRPLEYKYGQPGVKIGQ